MCREFMHFLQLFSGYVFDTDFPLFNCDRDHELVVANGRNCVFCLIKDLDNVACWLKGSAP